MVILRLRTAEPMHTTFTCASFGVAEKPRNGDPYAPSRRQPQPREAQSEGKDIKINFSIIPLHTPTK